MPVTREQLGAALGAVSYPGFRRDVLSLGVVRNYEIVERGQKTIARLELDLSRTPSGVAERIRAALRSRLAELTGVDGVEFAGERPAQGSPALPVAGAAPPSVASRGAVDAGLLAGVRHVVAVASGKGGVGKSTLAVNLAVALAAEGCATGLLDADIYGPSIPLMMGVTDERPAFDGNRLRPFEREGVRFMSLGNLVPADQAMIWRGPLVMKAVEQLLRDVSWGDLDVLIVDLPPGTGDVQLTLSQRVNLSGAVVVTTPQQVALADVLKAIAMFRKVNVPILGLVENMSSFRCPHCGEATEIFGNGGGRRQAEELQIPFLGEVPLDPRIRASGDAGRPFLSSAERDEATPLRNVARGLLAALGQQAGSGGDAPGPPGIFERFRRVLGRETDS